MLLNMNTKVIFIFSLLFIVSPYSFAGMGHSDDNLHVQTSHAEQAHHKSTAGLPASEQDVTKTIKVTMLDAMKYEFSEPLEISQGDVVKFLVNNEGNLVHEFSIGSLSEQKNHGKEMRNNPNMVHTDNNTISLKGGESGQLIWRFEGDSQVYISCNIPGHFEAGMFKKIVIQ